VDNTRDMTSHSTVTSHLRSRVSMIKATETSLINSKDISRTSNRLNTIDETITHHLSRVMTRGIIHHRGTISSRATRINLEADISREVTISMIDQERVINREVIISTIARGMNISSRITGHGIEYMSHHNFEGILSNQVHIDAYEGLESKT
jgi:hypothetical protein